MIKVIISLNVKETKFKTSFLKCNNVKASFLNEELINAKILFSKRKSINVKISFSNKKFTNNKITFLKKK